jgi:hypothetical protein
MDPKSPGYETGLIGYCIIKKILIQNPCMLIRHGGPGAIVYHPSPPCMSDGSNQCEIFNGTLKHDIILIPDLSRLLKGV